MIDYSNINQTRHLIIVNKSLKQKNFLYDKPSDWPQQYKNW